MNTVPQLSSILEALLFVAGEPLTIPKLAQLTEHSASDVKTALLQLEEILRARGIRLLQNNDTVTLVTAPDFSSYVEKLIKEEVLGDISRAALETLTIIVYQHPVSRPQIDYIRGVNSSFMLRNLIARGLVERVATGERAYQYQPTLECMKFLGLSSFKELPEYEDIQKQLLNGLEQRPEKEAY